MKNRSKKRPVKQKTAKFSINGTIVSVKFTKKLGVRIDKDDGYTLVLMRKNARGKVTLIEYHPEVPTIIDNPHITKKELAAIIRQIRIFRNEKDEMDEDFSDLMTGKNDISSIKPDVGGIENNGMFV